MHALPEKTARLFEVIKPMEEIGQFLLVGGTALALRLCHRLSEDLDFMTTGKLNRPAIDRLLDQLKAHGHKVTRIVDPIAHLEFEMEGADASEYGQDWRVDGVKLSFLSKRVQTETAQHELETRLQPAEIPDVETGNIRVASEACVFALKAQVLSERLISRDMFDLKTLIETGRYGMADLLSETKALGGNVDLVKERLIHGRLRTDDPPVNTVNGEPCDVEALRAWFAEQVNNYERDVAAQRYRATKSRTPR